MKTFEETFGIGTAVINKEKFKEIQNDIFAECINVCKEGQDVFKRLDAKQASMACAECADNIAILQIQNNI